MTGVYPLKKSKSDPNLSKLLVSIFYTLLKNSFSFLLHKGVLFPSPFANYLAKLFCILLRSIWLTQMCETLSLRCLILISI